MIWAPPNADSDGCLGKTAVATQRFSMIRRNCLTRLKTIKEACTTDREARKTVPRMNKDLVMDDIQHALNLRSIERVDKGPAPRWLTSETVDRVGAAESRPFNDEEYQTRLDLVRLRMARMELDALIVFRPSSVEYLCGHHTAETTPQPLVVTDSTTSLYLPDLELGRAVATARVDYLYYCSYTGALQGLRQFLNHAMAMLPTAARVGVETAHTSTPPQALNIVAENGATVIDSNYLVERERLVLSAAEIRCVEQAGEISSEGVRAAVAEAGRDGATESSIAGSIAEALTIHADSISAWGPVVVTGDRAGIPHSSFAAHPLRPGPIFMEFSGTHHRYHAPVMRTLIAGPLDPQDRVLVELAQTAVASVLEHARPGVPCSVVADRANQALGPLPNDVVFHQLFGYPVGLAHKPHWMDGMPFHIAADNHEPLEEGMVFHIPSSFRRFGVSGVGLSQTFLVERHGARALTHGPAEIIDLTEDAV